jgi:SAM-dependent methyltransferase
MATIDQEKLEAFLGQAVTDAGAALSVLLTHLGDRLGLYRAMTDGRPTTAEQLAAKTGTHERMVREWLSNQAAGGYVEYDPASQTFRLPAEQAFVLADESSPALAQGLFQMVAAVYQNVDKEEAALQTGKGLTWGDHHTDLFEATERTFRPGYSAHLVAEWIPALRGIAERLESGGTVADVGCGFGSSTVIMAQAYPQSSFVGLDYHEPSIERARVAAKNAGVGDRIRFEVADATQLSGSYDLIAFFDCWHDTADPLGAATAARAALAAGGSVMVVEPLAADRLEDNFNPLGRFAYGASSLICTPCSVSDGGPGLGAQAGEARSRDLFVAAGFSSLERVTETPLNAVYEARV